MTHKRLIFLSLAFLMVPLTIFAAPRSFLQAKAIAERQAAKLGISIDESFASQAKAFSGMDFSDETANFAKSSGSSASSQTEDFYVFPNGENKGFTIVSGDDRMPEVVGYSASGTCDVNHLPDNFVNFMKAYQEMAVAVTQGDVQAVAAVAEVQGLRSSTDYQQPVVRPLLGEITWNQGSPYNNMCPTYRGSSRAVTGCVATAMAQILAYYRYPAQLKATIPSYVTSSYGIAVGSIPAGEKYDWANMRPKYLTGGYTSDQAAAVAKLMYHCGAAVKMDYGPSSGASISDDVFKRYFGYDEELATTVFRYDFSTLEWLKLLDAEMQAKRPVLYTGSSSSGGHAFVCDGTDGNGFYHINWGWGGSQDGYFDIAILNPDKGGIGSGNAADGYNRYNAMLIGLVPDNGKVDEPLIKSSYLYVKTVTPSIAKASRNYVSDSFTGTLIYECGNVSTQQFSGLLAAGIKNPDGTYTMVTDKKRVTLRASPGNGSYYPQTVSLNMDYPFVTGVAEICLLASKDNGATWTQAYGPQPLVYFKATDKALTIADGPEVAVDMTHEGQLLAGMQNTFAIQVKNTSTCDFIGELKIYTSQTNSRPSAASKSVYALLAGWASNTYDVTFTPQSGDFYVWITDEEETVLCSKHFVVETAEAPQLKLVSITTNATPGEFEMENAKFYDDKVKLPRINDDKAKFIFSIRNDGGTYNTTFGVYGWGVNNGGRKQEYRTMTFPAGETVDVEFTVGYNEIGENTIYSYIMWYDETANLDISALPDNNIDLVDGSGYYPRKKDCKYVYLTGIPSAISSVANASTYIRGGEGKIYMLLDKSLCLPVYNLNGQKVAEVNLKAHEEQTLSIAPGVYIVNGKKILVR